MKCARSTRTPSTWCRPCSRRWASRRRRRSRGVTQSPIEGHSFAHAFNDGKAPSKHITQYFEMFGHRSIYHDGWRAVCPWPGTSFKEAGAFFGAPIDKDKLTELDAKGWELYHVEKDFAENHNLAAEEPAEADRDDRDVVCRGGEVQRPADRLARHAAICRSASAARRGAQELPLLPGHADGAGQRRPHGPESAPQHDGGRRDPQGRRGRRVASRRATSRAGLPSTSRTASCTTSTTTSAASSSTSSRTCRSRRGATSCASSSR